MRDIARERCALRRGIVVADVVGQSLEPAIPDALGSGRSGRQGIGCGTVFRGARKDSASVVQTLAAIFD